MAKATHNEHGFNPLGNPRTIPNVSKGEDVGKSYGASKGGYTPKPFTSKIGPTIAPGYLVTGEGSTSATGGPFTKANTAKKAKGVKVKNAKQVE